MNYLRPSSLRAIIRNAALVITLCAGTVLFAGCIEFGEDIWINLDGTGRMRIDIAIPEALMSLGNSMGAAADSTESPAVKFHDEEKKFAANPKVARAGVRDTVIDEMHHFMFEVDAKSYNDLPELHRMFYADSALAGNDATSQAKPELRIVTEANIVKFAMVLPRDTTRMDVDTTGAADSIGAAIAGAMMGGKGFVFRLHAEHVTKSNAAYDTVAHVVEWHIPLTELQHSKGREFTAEITMPKPIAPITAMSVWVWVVAAGVVLVVFLVVVVRKSSQR